MSATLLPRPPLAIPLAQTLSIYLSSSGRRTYGAAGSRSGRSASSRRRGTPAGSSRRGRPPVEDYSDVESSSVLPAKLLVLGSLAFVVASILALVVSFGSATSVPFGSALAGYVLAALANAMHRVRCDRLRVSDRFLSAVALQFVTLLVAVVCAYSAARGAAL